jgi:hypothetical protein
MVALKIWGNLSKDRSYLEQKDSLQERDWESKGW